MKTKCIFILLLIFIANKFGNCFKYTNYTLIRAVPVDNTQLSYLENLTDLYNVNYWRSPGLLKMPVEFSIEPKQLARLHKDAVLREINLTIVAHDIQKLFDEQTVVPYVRRNMETFNWNSFYRLYDIYNWLYDLQGLYPEVVKIKNIGKTVEKRDILAVQVILPNSLRRSRVVIEGGIHAREWIAPAFVTYLINEIVHAETSNDSKLKTIAMTYEWHFVPVLNPDGYEFSHEKDRLWRKNGRGVDINRNFDSGFGTKGVSSNPTSVIYGGEKAFSEPESKAMAKFIQSKSKNLEYYVGFHSYGQYMIIPYAHKKEHLENFYEVEKKCKKAARFISNRFGSKYKIGTAFDTVGYMTSGVSSCWVKKKFHTPYVVIFELRDQGTYGFALPPNLIIPTCLETMDGVMELLTPDDQKANKNKNRDEQYENDITAHDGEERRVFDKLILLLDFLFFIVLKY